MQNEDLYKQKTELRKELIKNAYWVIYVQGTHPAEWETDPDVIAKAKSCGIENELSHIAALTYQGWRGDYQRHL